MEVIRQHKSPTAFNLRGTAALCPQDRRIGKAEEGLKTVTMGGHCCHQEQNLENSNCCFATVLSLN